jgi:UDPglucose 6-dehydrogenase
MRIGIVGSDKIMRIGIVGSEGIVGSTCKFGFEKVGHDVLYHDTKLGTSIEDVLDTEIIFICVPTPTKEDGSCDISIVESVIEEIHSHRLQMKMEKPEIIAIKSTIVPGTTESFISRYKDLQFAFVPEFLRERCAISDFTENHDACVIGTHSEEIFEKIKIVHGKLPKKFVRLSPTEAEFVKYFTNTFNAMRIVFANSFYEICNKYDVNYTMIKDTAINMHHIPHNYLECNENMRGFAGVCLPKDLRVLVKMSEGTCVEFFCNILKENEKYNKTVFKGMRKDV